MPNPESNLKAEFIYTVIFIGLNGSILLKPGIEKKKKIKKQFVINFLQVGNETVQFKMYLNGALVGGKNTSAKGWRLDTIPKG